jgi:transposase-like protein
MAQPCQNRCRQIQATKTASIGLAYDFLRFLRLPQESTQSWREVLLGLKGRGMNCPQLAIGDGAMGFWSALDEVYPQSKQQRCWVHKTANVLNCVPKSVQPKVKDALHQIWQADTQSNAHQAFDRFEQLFCSEISQGRAMLAEGQR